MQALADAQQKMSQLSETAGEDAVLKQRIAMLEAELASLKSDRGSLEEDRQKAV